MKVTELRPEPKLPPPTGYVLELTPAELHFLKEACLHYGKIASATGIAAAGRFNRITGSSENLQWSPEICFRD